MNWNAGEYVLLATGLLFVVAIVIGFTTRVHLSRTSYVVFSLAAIVCIVTGTVLSTIDVVWYPIALWALPVFPAAVIVIELRYAARSRGALAEPAAQRGQLTASGDTATALAVGTTEDAAAAASAPRIAANSSSRDNPGDDAAPRARAHNPHTPAAELADIAFGYPSLRATVAANPATPANVLHWLSELRDPVVTAAISARGSSMSLLSTARRPPAGVVSEPAPSGDAARHEASTH